MIDVLNSPERNIYGALVQGNLREQRRALKAELKKLELSARSPATLVFVNDSLNYLGSCDWLPGNSSWRKDLTRFKVSGATGYFLAQRRRMVDGEPSGDVDELRLFAEHLGLSLIEVLRWG